MFFWGLVLLHLFPFVHTKPRSLFCLKQLNNAENHKINIYNKTYALFAH